MAAVSAKRRAIEAHSEPVDLVVVVSHISVKNASRVASAVPGIDLFVTGHSHEKTPEPIRVGKTLIVQAGAFAQRLGRLRLEVDGGEATVVANELLPTEEAPAIAGTPFGAVHRRGLLQLATVALAFLATALLVLL